MERQSHFNTRPMSRFGGRLFRMALHVTKQQMANQEPQAVGIQLHLSDIAERIARDLAHAAALQMGVPQSVWGDLPQGVRERYRTLGERAVNTIDPHVRLAAADDAVTATDEWMNGPGNMAVDAPTTVEIAREAISRYELNLLNVKPEWK